MSVSSLGISFMATKYILLLQASEIISMENRDSLQILRIKQNAQESFWSDYLASFFLSANIHWSPTVCQVLFSVDKESTWNAGGQDLIPMSGRSPGEGNGNPLQYSCLENPMDREACLQSIESQRVRHDWRDLAVGIQLWAKQITYLHGV